MTAAYEHDLLLQLGGYLDAAFMGEGVGLQTHAEIREVDAWFDAERGSRHDRAGIVGLEAVEVHAVGVGFGADAVPQSVYELIAVAGGANGLPGNPIDCRSGNGPAGAQLVLKELDGGIASIPDYPEDLLFAIRGRPTDDRDPGYVGIDGIFWLSLLGPGVD